MFFNPECAEIYQFALDMQQKHGDFPSEAFTKQNFPNFQRVKISDPLSMLIEAFKEWRRAQVIKQRLAAAADAYAEGDLDGAIAVLEDGLGQVAAESLTDDGDVDLTENALERYDEYLAFRDRPDGLLGVTTGFPTLDEVLSGLQPKQLITVVALPKVGKSTLAMQMCIKAHDEGSAVMFQTIEMSAVEMRQRHDAMRSQVSFNRFRTGRMRESEERAYRSMLRTTGAMENSFLITESVTNLAQIAAKIEEAKPEIVVVDGVYLLQSHPDFAPGTPQALTYLSRAFKKMAQTTNTTIILTTQALAQKLQGGKLSAHSIGYSSSFFQDSDLVIGLEMNEAQDEDVRELSILGSRNSGGAQVTLDWDWEHGMFQEMGAGA